MVLISPDAGIQKGFRRLLVTVADTCVPSMSSATYSLFVAAERLYAQGNVDECFVTYQKCIKKALKEGLPTAPIPNASQLANDFPREMLGVVWRNFVGLIRDPARNYTEQSHPEAYKLLETFRPGTSSKIHARLERTARGKILLKGLQVSAGFTLGLMAWDARDRPKAAKRYKEALDLAATHPPFVTLSPDSGGLERYVYGEVQQAKENLDQLVENDAFNGLASAAVRPDGRLPERGEEAELPVQFKVLRQDKSGRVDTESSVVYATEACGGCGKRDVKLLRCASCRKVHCERCFSTSRTDETG